MKQRIKFGNKESLIKDMEGGADAQIYGDHLFLNKSINEENWKINLPKEISRFEVRLIKYALRKTNGNQTRAASLLGLNMTTLNAKIKRLGIVI